MTETPFVEIECKESENKKIYLTRLLLLSCFLYMAAKSKKAKLNQNQHPLIQFPAKNFLYCSWIELFLY